MYADNKVEKQIADQAKVHNLHEDEVICKVILDKRAIKEFVSKTSIVALSLYLTSDAASTFTGTALHIDGGWSTQKEKAANCKLSKAIVQAW